MEKVFDPVFWAEFGLAGMVILALIVGLIFIVRGMVEQFTDSLDKINSDHKEERKEWRQEAERRGGKTDSVIKELTHAVLKLKLDDKKKEE